MEVWILDNYVVGSMRAFKTEEQAFKAGLKEIMEEYRFNPDEDIDNTITAITILNEYIEDYNSSCDSFGIDDWFLITPVTIEEE